MSEVVEKIVAAIRKQGAISLARFMELALYCPVYGYYEKEEDRIGRGGDYYTSVSVGSLFGELLACQFAEWLKGGSQGEECQESGVQCHGSGQEGVEGGGPKSKVQSSKSKVRSRSLRSRGQGGGGGVEIVEVGAHRGELARDILRWLRELREELYESLAYCIVEPSERRRGWQQETLDEFKPKVRWVSRIGELETVGAKGPAHDSPRIIFSNELLDAFPVHRFGWDARRRRWFEWGIRLEHGRLGWTQMPGPAELHPVPSPLEAALPDGFTREVCPAAMEWWSRAAAVLRRGRLVTFDYGFTSDESLLPERHAGTVRGYFRHQVSLDVLAHPGEQDITSHVDFSAIRGAGESTGLETEAFVTQSQFLTRIVEKILSGAVKFGEWTPERTRQFQTLTHPEHLGRAFRVLVQARRAKA